jgi:hypothetical protein
MENGPASKYRTRKDGGLQYRCLSQIGHHSSDLFQLEIEIGRLIELEKEIANLKNLVAKPYLRRS